MEVFLPMRNTKKKGFTIVELVIVIAVIAILAAVMIPTFGGVIESANESAATQAASNEWKNYCALHATTFGEFDGIITVNTDDDDAIEYYVEVTDGQLGDTFKGAYTPAEGKVLAAEVYENHDNAKVVINKIVDAPAAGGAGA